MKCDGRECRDKKEEDRNEAEDMHPCPYQQEINDDEGDSCTCCYTCRQECVDDI